MNLKYVRCYADADAAGETHFEERELALTAPQPGSSERSPKLPGGEIDFVRMPAGHFHDWHPTPHRWIGVIVQGTVEVTASDGEARRFGVGDVHAHEDTGGKGHQTRVIGDEAVVLMRAQLS
jgi:hypothetical protein